MNMDRFGHIRLETLKTGSTHDWTHRRSIGCTAWWGVGGLKIAPQRSQWLSLVWLVRLLIRHFLVLRGWLQSPLQGDWLKKFYNMHICMACECSTGCRMLAAGGRCILLSPLGALGQGEDVRSLANIYMQERLQNEIKCRLPAACMWFCKAFMEKRKSKGETSFTFTGFIATFYHPYSFGSYMHDYPGATLDSCHLLCYYTLSYWFILTSAALSVHFGVCSSDHRVDFVHTLRGRWLYLMVLDSFELDERVTALVLFFSAWQSCVNLLLVMFFFS